MTERSIYLQHIKDVPEYIEAREDVDTLILYCSMCAQTLGIFTHHATPEELSITIFQHQHDQEKT